MERMGQDPATFIAHLRAHALAIAPYAVFMLLLRVRRHRLMLAWRDRGKTYGEHFVFSLHLHAFWFLALLLVALLPHDLADLVQLIIPVYGVMALREVYGGGWPGTVARAAVASVLYVIALLGATAALLALLLATADVSGAARTTGRDAPAGARRATGARPPIAVQVPPGPLVSPKPSSVAARLRSAARALTMATGRPRGTSHRARSGPRGPRRGRARHEQVPLRRRQLHLSQRPVDPARRATWRPRAFARVNAPLPQHGMRYPVCRFGRKARASGHFSCCPPVRLGHLRRPSSAFSRPRSRSRTPRRAASRVDAQARPLGRPLESEGDSLVTARAALGIAPGNVAGGAASSNWTAAARNCRMSSLKSSAGVLQAPRSARRAGGSRGQRQAEGRRATQGEQALHGNPPGSAQAPGQHHGIAASRATARGSTPCSVVTAAGSAGPRSPAGAPRHRGRRRGNPARRWPRSRGRGRCAGS